LVAKVTCIGGDTDNPKVVVQEEPKASLEDILAKVKSTMVSKNYKIKSVKFDGTSWRANILDDDTYIELIFDRGGKLQMKLLSD
jgi:membrane protein implicated in regulation of membrane protease activity